jgi:hypothetical protein
LYAAFQTRFAGLGAGSVQPRFVVGELPSTDLAGLIPDGATMLGGVVLRRSSGAIVTSTAALLMPGEARDAERRMIDRLKSRGFRLAEPPGQSEEGFMPSRNSSPFDPWNYFCGDSTSINFSSQNRPEGGAYVVLQVDRIRGQGGVCNPGPHFSAMRGSGPPKHLSFPRLEPPEAAAGRQTGSSGWGGDMKTRSMTAELETDLSADAVVEHYTKEFMKHGWRPRKRFKEGNVVMQLLRDDSGGTPRELLLTDVQLPDRTHTVTAQVYAISPRNP